MRGLGEDCGHQPPHDELETDALAGHATDPIGGGIVDLDHEQDASERGSGRAHESLFAVDHDDVDIDIDVLAGPVHWPSVPSSEIAERFQQLRDWVEQLIDRFEHLNHTIIPPCWWQHNGHIEALQALKDHERISYADTSPGQAALAWHHDLQFTEQRLREWTTSHGCDRKTHRTPIRTTTTVDDETFSAHLQTEQARRAERAQADATDRDPRKDRAGQ